MKISKLKSSPKAIERNLLTDEQFATKVSLEKDNIKLYLGKLFKNNEIEMELIATLALQRAVNNYKKYDGVDAVDTWLYGVVTNVAIDHIKAKRKSISIN